jgi:hypothetical protein
MRTDNLIRALTQDMERPRASILLLLGMAVAVGGVIALLLFLATLGTRPDLAAVVGTWRFLFKLSVPIVTFGAAFWACLQLARPECGVRDVLPALAIGPALALTGVAVELALTPASSWEVRALGRYSGTCLVAIPSLSAVSLMAALAVLKKGAPSSPALSGATAGLLTGALSAGIYATHCPDDSPLFFALWYVAAVSIVVLAGFLCGRRILRW